MNIFERSAIKRKNKLSYFEIPEWVELGWIQHAFLTRHGGVSLSPYDSLNLSDRNGDVKENVSKNKDLVSSIFDFDLKRMILLDQMQHDAILLLKKPIMTLSSPLEYDAMITNSPNTFLGILTADCLPIFVADQRKRVIAAIHAGRVGTGLHITEKVLKKMKEEFGCSSRDSFINIGPSIGSCCYEIDENGFRPEWEPFSISKGEAKWMLDLAQINIAQMKKEGIREEQISWVNLCTHCHTDLFFSYRKEGCTGRQLSFIGIVE
jgi:YfiH family protein